MHFIGASRVTASVTRLAPMKCCSGGVHIIHIIQMAAVVGGMRSCAFHWSHSQRDSTRSTTFRSVAFASLIFTIDVCFHSELVIKLGTGYARS